MDYPQQLLMLQFNRVHKSYEQYPVLEIPEIFLERKIYWLQGANGSGKTTLLSMVAGLIPFHGDILLDGIDLRQNPVVYRRLVNFAEAEPQYPGFITGIELVRFFAQIRKASRDQTDMLVNLFRVRHFLSAQTGTYSSGMVKKLSLLLAFIGKPALILMDEPFATLDESTIHIIPDLMAAYQKEWKTGFIFSSHQPFPSISPGHTRLLVSDHSLQFVA